MRVLYRSPRLAALAIGCALSFGIFLGLEAAARVYVSLGPGWRDEFSCRAIDPVLGGGFRPDCHDRWVRRRRGVLLWSADFSTDQLGRRRTVRSTRPSSAGATVFFGCSYVLGAGVDDSDTLPSAFQRLVPDQAVYNYGGSSFGPQQMLATLRQRDVTAEVAAASSRRTLVYSFLGFHVPRAIGSFSHYRWAKHFPYFHETSAGRLVQSGSFRTGRPLLSFAYEIGHSSELLRRLIREHPRTDTEEHFRLTARIIQESAAAFHESWPHGDFRVLVYPGSKPARHEPVLRRLDTAVLTIHDYSNLIDMREAGYRVADGHPSSLAHQMVAARLARDLRAGPRSK